MRNLRILSVLALLVVFPVQAWSAGPSLTAKSQIPSSVESGVPAVFHVTYTSPSGDAATDIRMVLHGKDGDKTVLPTAPEGKDPAAGIDYTFTYTPPDVGEYTYHFVATSAAQQSVTWPSPDAEFAAYSIVRNWIILGIGIVIAMLALPFLVYTVARATNKQGNPATAARVGLVVGVIASYALGMYLFAGINARLAWPLGSVAAVAMLIAILTRR